MKIRTDFVTNSSSSSFVIGKKDDESATVESVFSIVKDLYKEYLSKRDSLVEYIKNNPKLKLKYGKDENWDNGLYWFTISDDKTSQRNEDQIWRSIERGFGISRWDWFEESYEWLNCKTYDNYEEYWINKMQKTKNYKVHAPFTIIDLSDSRPIRCLHVNDGTGEYHEDLRSSVFGWYYDENEHCASKTKNIPLDEVYVSMLGRVCIYSESGYIPDYIVDRLYDISEYGCNHMG